MILGAVLTVSFRQELKVMWKSWSWDRDKGGGGDEKGADLGPTFAPDTLYRQISK